MILRRFMKHVTEQNWFAVGLDVIVVIVGIFLGLQVQGWYEDRSERVLEQNYLLSLHNDVQSSTQTLSVTLSSQVKIRTHLIEILDYLAGELSQDNLTTEHCIQMSLSHVLYNAIPGLPAAQSLITSGDMEIIQSDQLKKNIASYLAAAELLNSRQENIRSTMTEISASHPDIIEIDVQAAKKLVLGETSAPVCHFEKMNENTLLKNQLAMNAMRQTFLLSTLNTQRAALEELHKLIDQVLSITHEVGN